MRRSRCRSAAGLLTAALFSSAAAAPCEAPEALLQVFVQGSDRGTQVVRLEPGTGAARVLLPPDVLRPGEAALLGERLTCDGEAFVTLAADVAVRYDAGAQTLSLTLPPARLGSGVADFADLSLGPPPLYGEAGWAVTFGVRGAAEFGGLDGWTAGAYADVGTARGKLSGSLGAAAAREADGASAQPRAVLRYAVTPDVRVSGVWNAEPTGEAPGFGVTDFRGVALEGRGGPPRVRPDDRLELPLPADVEVRVDGRLLRSFRAGAGTLILRNVPLPPGGYTLRVTLTDETGTREVEERVPAEAVRLPSGTFAYAAQAGWTSRGYLAGASGQVGLRGGWTPHPAAAGRRGPRGPRTAPDPSPPPRHPHRAPGLPPRRLPPRPHLSPADRRMRRGGTGAGPGSRPRLPLAPVERAGRTARRSARPAGAGARPHPASGGDGPGPWNALSRGTRGGKRRGSAAILGPHRKTTLMTPLASPAVHAPAGRAIGAPGAR